MYFLGAIEKVILQEGASVVNGRRKEETMKLSDVLNLLTNRDFLFTVDGLCDGWYGGSDKLKEEGYYGTYKNRTVESMEILLTNGIPELCIRLKED